VIAVTGASGHLGRHVVDSLIERGVAPSTIVALVRNAAKASDLARRGVVVRTADYSRPDELAAALDGVDKLLLISGNDVGKRVTQHRNVIDAARKAGVRLLAYTSVLEGKSNPILLASDHKATERMIRASGLPFVFLRNGWYIENYTDRLASTLEHGAIFGSAGDGRVSAATRKDFAEGAAAVLATNGHENRIYELGGDNGFTLAELAAEISRQSGRAVAYNDLPVDAYTKVLVGAGLPEAYAKILADSDMGIARGHLFTDSGDLRRLAGRPTTPLSVAVADGLARIDVLARS
jgi:NAD(P)H dehydrogenase (quinone)